MSELSLDDIQRLRRALPASDEARDIAREIAALADPSRLSLLAAIGAGDELAVGDMAAVVDRQLSAVSQHLRILRSAGVVESRRDGKRVLTSLTPRGVELLRAAFAKGA